MILPRYDIEIQRLINKHGSVQAALDYMESMVVTCDELADRNGVVGNSGPRVIARRNEELWLYAVDNYTL